MKTDTERVPLLMERTKTGLVPCTRVAAEMLAKYPLGARLEITPRQRRSTERNALYWALLGAAVQATNAYPTAEHLHDAIKLALGYTTPLKKLDGEIIWVPDSTAFGKMDESAFSEFLTRAIELLTKLLGRDPMDLLKAAEAA